VFSVGNTCNLVATPNSPDTASCSVQFLPPAGSSRGPAITASYPGDAHHAASSGKTFYPSAGELSGDIELSGNDTLTANGGGVEVPVECKFPCSTSGELISGPDFSSETAKAHKKHKARAIVLGTGSLSLSKPGKGTLVIKLNSKAKRTLAKAKGRTVKAVLTVTVHTATGTLVKTDRKTVTIRPHTNSKKYHKHSKRR
jgi:hypothetical protein